MTWFDFIQQGDRNMAIAIIALGPAIDGIMGPVTAWQLKHACIKQGEVNSFSDMVERLNKAHEAVKTDDGLCSTLVHAALHMQEFLHKELSEEDFQHLNQVLKRFNKHPHLDEGDQNDPDIEYPKLFQKDPEESVEQDMNKVGAALSNLFGGIGKIDE